MSTAAVVLAAGKGTRFRSDSAKVLHRAAGRSLVGWVLEALRPLALERTVVVVGHQAEQVCAELDEIAVPGTVAVSQAEQRGTGHAVRCAFDAGVLDGLDTVLVLAGDSPLITDEALAALLEAHDGNAATLLTSVMEDPTGYGRVVRGDDGRVQRIVEERDATPDERRLREVNTSFYAFAAAPLAAAVARLSADNAQGEEYLTDVVAALAQGGAVGTVTVPAELTAGVNDRAELAAAAAVLRRRTLERLMRAGVTVVDPAQTYVEPRVEVAPDAILLPGVHLEGRTVVGAGAVIGPNSRLVDATVAEQASVAYSVVLGAWVGPGATVGPFTYLRPGTRLDARSKAGAFVEMKASHIGEGSKVPHLSYIGDATVGRDVNIGAGTITCNYDGYAKHATVIGDGAFIGSDTMLVAPVEIGPSAVTGAASAITKDVPAGALAVERNDQLIITGYAERRAARRTASPETP